MSLLHSIGFSCRITGMDYDSSLPTQIMDRDQFWVGMVSEGSGWDGLVHSTIRLGSTLLHSIGFSCRITGMDYDSSLPTQIMDRDQFWVGMDWEGSGRDGLDGTTNFVSIGVCLSMRLHISRVRCLQ